jgi:hypothetical protein
MSRVPRLPLLTLAAFVLTLTACGADEPAGPEAAVSKHAPAHDENPAQREQAAGSESPAPSASPVAPAPSAAPHQRQKGTKRQKPAPVMGQPLHRTTPASHLLTAARMPSPDGDTAWRIADRAPEDAVVGACQKTDLETIGAVSAVRRTFAAGPDGPWATQVVAEFADPKSAWRAHEVLRAWQADCEDRLDFARTEVGPLRTVDVPAGTGENYRTTYGPRSAGRGWATGLGIVRRGHHLSVVEYRTAAMDYPTDRDPARMAVRRIARSFA